MATEHRLRAQQQLANLLELLRQQPDQADLAPLIAIGEQLDRAITSFHLEAIRLRMYTLGRQLAQRETLPADTRTLFDAIRASLESAGFHTSSISL